MTTGATLQQITFVLCHYQQTDYYLHTGGISMTTDTFDIPVQFQSAVSVINAYGEPEYTYSDDFRLGCRIQQYSAQRTFESGEAQVSGNAVFITTRRNRNTIQVDTNYRAVLDGQVYRIIGVDRTRYRRDTIRFIADAVE